MATALAWTAPAAFASGFQFTRDDRRAEITVETYVEEPEGGFSDAETYEFAPSAPFADFDLDEIEVIRFQDDFPGPGPAPQPDTGGGHVTQHSTLGATRIHATGSATGYRSAFDTRGVFPTQHSGFAQSRFDIRFEVTTEVEARLVASKSGSNPATIGLDRVDLVPLENLFRSSHEDGDAWALTVILAPGEYRLYASASSTGGDPRTFDVALAIVPEPGTALLLSVGLVAVARHRRRPSARIC